MAQLTKENLRILPPAAKYLKKLKDKKLKKLYQDAIDSILDDPFCKFRSDGTLFPLTAAWSFRSERHEFPLLTA